jgi:hypothetical protein
VRAARSASSTFDEAAAKADGTPYLLLLAANGLEGESHNLLDTARAQLRQAAVDFRELATSLQQLQQHWEWLGDDLVTRRERLAEGSYQLVPGAP